MKNEFILRDDVVFITLNSIKYGKMETIVDIGDLPAIQMFEGTWFPVWSPLTKSFYCVGNLRVANGSRTVIRMHRWILQAPKDKVVDHINHDTLNNTRTNLRIVDRSQNNQNRAGANSNSKSMVRGVYWHKRDSKWYASVRKDGKATHVGSFDDLEDANLAVIKAREELLPFSNENEVGE